MLMSRETTLATFKLLASVVSMIISMTVLGHTLAFELV